MWLSLLSWQKLAKFLILSAAVMSLSVNAGVGVSTIRIYLDNDKSEENFLVYSKDPKLQHCTLWVKHYGIAEDGRIISLADDFQPDNSAEPLIRYSPKTFSLAAAQTQSVRFRMRRKPNIEDAEYRAFLVVDCEFDETDLSKDREDVQYGLVPRLRHNIPIVVRTAKLDASVEITNINVSEESISFSILRQGTRSVYGRLELIDTRTDRVVADNSHFVLYPETSKKQVQFPTKGVNPKDLGIRFIENAKEGGSINLIKPVL
jgi:P pilus assembly chaperone PapD